MSETPSVNRDQLHDSDGSLQALRLARAAGFGR
jgi:hypothetical protein